MKIRSATFLTSAPTVETAPALTLAEFAFIGRSNVGKSSLLNMLSGKAGLAKVSGRPGHTQLINFFILNDAWSLVDLPGYGYATMLKSERARFEEMIEGYLTRRENLRMVFVLVDSRHTPQKIDLEFIEWITSNGVPFALVFTKVDKAKTMQIEKNVALFLESIATFCPVAPPIFKTSSEKGTGRMELLSWIGKRLALTEE